jgi:two-component system, NtrC family, response regulator GlrR
MSVDFASLNLIGESPAFLRALSLVHRVSQCDATVLIEGETGTGKELAARAIHYLSPRKSGPFVPINCGAIPEALVESELFGHTRGAFTDAKEAREGVIAQARGGTLLLDEVDTLSPRSQVALLRFLQDQEYRPVGGRIVQRADVRIIAATNADLAALTDRGQYRQDLLFRLDLLKIKLPALRDRRDDVRLIAELFVTRFSQQYGTTKTLHPDSLASLSDYSWPGNVRELENAIHREFLLGEGSVLRILPRDAPAVAAEPRRQEPLTTVGFRAAKAKMIAEFERTYLIELLSRADGNLTRAARLSGKERSRLGKLVRKYGLTRAHFNHTI